MEKQTILDRLESFNEHLNLTHYWIIFLKYKKAIIVLPLFFGLLGYLIALNINPIFQSNATLVIEKQQRNVVDIDEVYTEGRTGFSQGGNYINNQVQILKSDEVFGTIFKDKETLAKVKNLYKKIPEKFALRNIKALKKLVFFKQDQDNNKNKKKLLNEKILKSYIKKNFEVTNVSRSDVLQLTFRSNNPELAKFLLTKIIEAYLQYDVDTKIGVTAYANLQINLRLSDLLKSMEKAETNLLSYKKENDLIEIGNIKVLKTDQIKSVSKRIIEANRELQKKETDLTAIKLAEGNIEELLAIADLRNKKEVDAIRTNISATNNNIEALQIIYKDEHPKLQKMFKTKINLDNRLKEILDENIAAAAFELANLNNFIKSSEEELDTAKIDLQILEEKDAALKTYVREVDMSTKIYETFLERMKETNEVKEIQSSGVKIIQAALLPAIPISPNIGRITMMFYLLSFMSIYSLLVYFEFNRNSVVEPSNLEALNIPILSTLPSVQKLDKGYHLSQIFIEDVNSEFAESIRTLRTLLVAKFSNKKSILLTSTYSGEGKTTIALNTSLAFSKIGKVLLVETDIRRPSVLSVISKDETKRPGFSDLIQGKVDFSETIVNIPGSEIDLLTSGSRRSDLTDLTTPQQLKEFFDHLKQMYDYVILDTPPIQPVSDTLFISQATDHNVIIARSRFTKLAGIKSAVKKLKNVNVSVDGLIFNDLDTSKASYYGYYQYGGYYRKYKSYT